MKKSILVLCTGNSCRSQIAEGYLRHFGGDQADIYSGGIETHGVNSRAVAVMAEDGIDISEHTSDKLTKYLGFDFDYVITVCDNANENCPYFPAKAQRIHQGFPDPAKATGSEEDILQSFRAVRDLIQEFSEEFVNDHVSNGAKFH